MSKFYILINPSKVPLGMLITVKFPFAAICPIPKTPKPYGGNLVITYNPTIEDDKLKLLEWDSFNEWINSLSMAIMSAEEMAHQVMSKFVGEINPDTVTLHMNISTPYHLPVKIYLDYQKKSGEG